MQQRLLYIDVAKAIGLCLVILSHSVCPNLAIFASGCFVAIFFVASGYTTNNFHVQKKVKRLLLPYVCFSGAMLSVYAIYQWISVSPVENTLTAVWGAFYSRYQLFPVGYPSNINLMFAGNAPLWFLTSMITAYIALVPLLKWPNLSGFFICGYIILACALAQLPVLLPWSVDCAPIMALFLYAGIKLREIDMLNNNNIMIWGLLLLGYVVATYFNGYINLSVRDYGNSVMLCAFTGVTGSALILKLSRILSGLGFGKVLGYFGEYSLTIFCVQLPLLVGTRILVEKTASVFAIIVPSEIVALVQLIVAIGLGYLLAVIARKLFPNIL